MNLKYTLGVIATIPILPILYVQGKKVRAKIPTLPEADGIEGISIGNPNSHIRLITIGESTFAGLGVRTHQEGFTGTLATALTTHLNTTVLWKVYARSGYTAKQITKEIIPNITETKVDLIVIGIGGNDAFTLNMPSKWSADIIQLVGDIRLKFKQTPIVFANMPPIKEFPAFTRLMKMTIGNLVEILGKTLEKPIANSPNVYYNNEIITLKDWTNRFNIKSSASDFFSDGVHPSKLTYQIWAKDMANFIVQNEEIKKQLSINLTNTMQLTD